MACLLLKHVVLCVQGLQGLKAPVTGMAKGLGSRGGGATLQRSKLNLTQKQQTWEPKLDSGNGGGGIGKGIFNGGSKTLEPSWFCFSGKQAVKWPHLQGDSMYSTCHVMRACSILCLRMQVVAAMTAATTMTTLMSLAMATTTVAMVASFAC